MLHRIDFRIVKVSKESYFTYYKVEKRFMLFFWEQSASPYFDSTAEAEEWIKEQLATRTEEVVG
ncbi:hypothetical protein QGX11_gp117 [Pseudomonas phage PPSC2]|uniref:Uncharacterized protein n=1 Tax=Pseudomonas phage PPSC2 TaxID=2041350 RepID=A0A2R2YAZ2_9CAUD|nr:hypothetical protein QGX11_gp117 [Pseudomonas phage PPSC2]ATN92880.1 hypothetical protein PPSC2_117 [Pseudomonas phage PPSC2]